MRREAPQKFFDYGPLFFPAGMLIVFFVVPFATMIAVSFFRRDPAGFYSPDFVFDNYARFLSLFFGKVLGFSLFLAITVAICAFARPESQRARLLPSGAIVLAVGCGTWGNTVRVRRSAWAGSLPVTTVSPKPVATSA